MAGDWMKIELELPDKPEVHEIAGILNIDPDAVTGKLIRVWSWFNKQTTNGNANGVTFSLLDRITCVTGFGEAMMFVGWIEQNDKVLCMPKFERHTSESAKTRALTAKRVNKKRSKNVTVSALPREEKRREENIKTIKNITQKNEFFADINPQIVSDYLSVRKAKRAPAVSKTVYSGLVRESKLAGITIEQALIVCIERNWVGFKAEWFKKDNAQYNKGYSMTDESFDSWLNGDKQERIVNHDA